MNKYIFIILFSVCLININCYNSSRKSLNELNKAIKADSNNAELYYERSVEYMIKKDFQNAYDDLSKAIKLKPDNAFYRTARGSYLFSNKYYKDALPDYLSILKEKSGMTEQFYSMILFDISKCYYHINEFDSSLTYSSLSQENGFGNDSILVQESISYFFIRDYKSALEKINQFIENNPKRKEDTQTKIYLGMLLSVNDKNKESLERFLELEKESDNIHEKIMNYIYGWIAANYESLGNKKLYQSYYLKIKNPDRIDISLFEKDFHIKLHPN